MCRIRKKSPHRRWTKEEEKFLIKYSETKTDGQIAKALKRSTSSVRTKRWRMYIMPVLEQTYKIKGAEIANLVGMDKSNIYTTWVKKGFKMQTIGRNKVASEDALVKFMKEHPQLWKASKCDYYFFCRYKWFKDRLEREKAGLEQYDRYKDFRFWTDREISRVKMLKKRGLTHREIAMEVGRSKHAIDYLSMKLNKENNYE